MTKHHAYSGARCPSCGVPYVEHAGLNQTCRALLAERALVKSLDAEIVRLRGLLAAKVKQVKGKK